MKTPKTLKLLFAALVLIVMTVCATKTAVVAQHQHAQHSHHVIYKVKPAKAHCWWYRGHWDCRKSG